MKFDQLLHLLCEMPQITLQGKKVMADNQPLKGMQLEDVVENIVFIRQPTPGGFIPEGYTLVYFMDSLESAQAMAKGEIPYKHVPRGTIMGGGNPITDVWKKKFHKPGHEHILGMIEANSMPHEIYVDMMTVRPKYQRNSINSKMIAIMRKSFPEAKVVFSDPTSDGEKFISKFQ